MMIPILSNAYKGYTTANSVERRINCFPELGEGKTVNKIHGTPGSKLFSNIGTFSSRGLYVFNDLLYTVMGNTLYEVATDGTATSKGTVNTNYGRVSMADNGTELIIVDGTNGYIFSSDTLTQIADADFPNGATTVAFLGGYFIVDDASNTGRYYYSALYDGTSWDALDFATAETIPDALVSVFEDHGQLLLFGDRSIEAWYVSGDADLPFSIVGGATIRWGLAARFSVSYFDNSVAFLGKRKEDGALQVVRLAGYQVERISNDAIEYEIQNYSVTNDAFSYSYTLFGHTFFVLGFPSANVTWVYDAATKLWHEMQTNGIRHISDGYAYFNNKHIISDFAHGELYQLDMGTYTDNGITIKRSFVMPYIHDNNEEYLFGPSLQVQLEHGIGLISGQGSDPKIMMDYTDDGKTWSNKKIRGIGKQGEYLVRAKWNRLGRFRNRAFRITMTDPVKFVVTGAYLK